MRYIAEMFIASFSWMNVLSAAYLFPTFCELAVGKETQLFFLWEFILDIAALTYLFSSYMGWGWWSSIPDLQVLRVNWEI